MQRKFSFIVTYWWCMLLAVIGLAVFCRASISSVISEQENRTLQTLPSLTAESWKNGSFTAELESYLSDYFPWRSRMLDQSANLMDALSVRDAEEVLVSIDLGAKLEGVEGAASSGAYADDGSADSQASAEPSPQEDNALAGSAQSVENDPVPLSGYSKYAFSYRNTDDGYSNIYRFGDDAIAETVNSLNAYRSVLPADGTVSFTYVPYSQVANGWLLGTDRCGWASNVEEALQEAVSDGVYVYSSVNELEPYMRDGEPVFYKTDHHWSTRGAYHMQRLMLEARGVPSADYEDFSYVVHDDFLGSIYNQVRGLTLQILSDELDVPDALAPTRAYVYRDLNVLIREVRYMEPERNSYSAILGGTHTPWYVVETGFHTGRNALVVCDSFGNAFIPYLTPYYDTVCQVDLRENYDFGSDGGASIRSYVDYYGIDDVYFVVSTGCGINSSYMRSIVIQYLG